MIGIAPFDFGRARPLRALQFFVLGCAALFLMFGCAPISGDQPGPRTPGTIIDDIAVQNLAKRQISQADRRFRTANVSVISHNGHVLIIGQVGSDDLKRQAEEVVNGLAHVRSVHNELTVGGTISLLARTNDSWLTSKVKTKLIADSAVPADRVKVITENGVVYLMGRITREQADEAVRVVSTTGGVQKIVKVIEYID